ncbi:MAG TPA: 4Fe-4S ferredoxin [Candidatus Cloacimonas sp.]|jgi:dissimilatory sulfite reductase (desulfoviridin) alpha/beta subunit|nr:4Fe-4S ferredoxin [Candidatus Cloacimonas sp.]
MKINRNLCDVCGTCAAVCSVAAITISEFKVEIDNEVCINCGNCKLVCPIKAIEGGEDD